MKRAERRGHYNRLKRNRKNYYGRGLEGSTPMSEGQLGCTVNTPTPCSCSMCTNGRRNSWNNSKEKLTLQEQKQLFESKEELETEHYE